MPVRVNIPSRIKVDPGALVELVPCIEDALAAAAGRALENSRDLVLSERGGYVGVRVHPPDITWTGGGAYDVQEALRAEIEGRIAAVLAEAAERAGIFEHAREGVVRPLSGRVAEPLDEERTDWLLRLYEVPGFEGGGDGEAVAFDSEAGEGDHPPATRVIDVWRALAPGWGRNVESRNAMIREAIRRWGTVTGGAYYGVIYRQTNGWGVYICSREPGRPSVSFLFNEIEKYVIRRVNNRYQFVQEVFVPPPGLGVLRHVASIRTRAERIAAIRRLMGRDIRSKILELARAPGTTSRETILDQLDRRVTVEIERRADAIAPEMVSMIELRIGGETVWVNAPAGYEWEGEARVIPITEERTVTEGDGGEGGGAGGAGAAGEGAGREEAGRRGGFVYTGEEGEPGEGPRFPHSRYTRTGTLDCSPLLGEPSLEELGEDGNTLRRMIEEIAYRLEIQPCEHAARFCVNAATALGSRAGTVAAFASSGTGEASSFTRPLDVDSGNLGLVDFRPVASPAIQFMRHIAGVTPLITRLSRSILRIYAKPEHRVKIQSRWSDPTSWGLHFLIELSPEIKQSVAFIFGMTCQVLLLQLLRTSRVQIDARLNNIETYARRFETHIVPQLTRIETLVNLRDRLQNFQNLVSARGAMERTLPSGAAGSVATAAVLPGGTWLTAARGVMEAIVETSRVPEGERGSEGEIVVGDDNTVRIWDGEGRLWNMAGLERAIAMRRGIIEDIDPLVKQLIELDEVMDRFRNTSVGVRAELEGILREMQENNREMTGKAEDSWVFAFRASKISENIRASTVPGTRFALRGIHLQVHEQIGEFFGGDPYYAEGINSIFNRELAIEGLTDFFEFTGLLLLAVVCPVAAFVVGAAVSLYHYSEALERERLFESLIDPELVLSRAEVEVELFAARLGVALSFIPEVGSILGRGAATGVRLGARGSARALGRSARSLYRGGARGAARGITRRFTESMARQLERGLMRAFIEEIAMDQFMNLVIEKLLEPVIRHIERETTMTGPVGGTEGAGRVMGRLEAERRRRAPAATPAGRGGRPPAPGSEESR